MMETFVSRKQKWPAPNSIPQVKRRRRNTLIRLWLRLFVPRKKKTVVALIALVFLTVLLSYAFLPGLDVHDEFPVIHTNPPEVPSLNFSATLSTVLHPRREKRVDCAAIIDGDVNEIKKAVSLSQELEYNETGISPRMYLLLTKNCQRFRSQRGYIMSPLSWEELKFPIAFSILVYSEIEMAERLLRAIYRPQNYYCIHVDSKSEDIHQAFKKIASCFPNVLLARRQLDVEWGSFTVLEADIICMLTLWPFKKWKYFINLTGQEFPLKTNSDLVKILKAFGGANDVHATLKETYVERWRYRFRPPPTWFLPVKGSVHITASRAFIDYVLHNTTAARILKWVKSLDYFQDEAFFSTLNHNPHLGVPGSYKGDPDWHEKKKPHLSRYKIWNTTEEAFCYANRWVRYICILSTGDLPVMVRSAYLFANKFFLHEDRIAINCLEEWLFNATRDNFLQIRQLDVSYYQNLDFVKNQIKVT